MPEKTEMPKVYLDTNFLLIPVQFKVDIFEELGRIIAGNPQILVLEPVMRELEKLSETANTKDKTASKVALQIIKQKHLKVVPSSLKSRADDAIILAAQKGDFVATQDKELKKRLKKKEVQIITLKNKSHLIIG